MSEREGVEIDYCPACRGIWLDRGELDKIVERQEGRFARRTDDHEREEEDDAGDARRGKRRRGGLADFFDFGG